MFPRPGKEGFFQFSVFSNFKKKESERNRGLFDDRTSSALESVENLFGEKHENASSVRPERQNPF